MANVEDVQLDKSFLSIGDNEYIRENFPDARATSGFSSGWVSDQRARARRNTCSALL